MCAPGLDRNPAALPLGGGVHEDQDALVVNVEEPLGLELQGGTPGQRVHKAAPRLDPANDRSIRVQGREIELCAGGKQSGASGFLDPVGDKPNSANARRTISTFSSDIPAQYPAQAGEGRVDIGLRWSRTPPIG